MSLYLTASNSSPPFQDAKTSRRRPAALRGQFAIGGHRFAHTKHVDVGFHLVSTKSTTSQAYLIKKPAFYSGHVWWCVFHVSIHVEPRILWSPRNFLQGRWTSGPASLGDTRNVANCKAAVFSLHIRIGLVFCFKSSVSFLTDQNIFKEWTNRSRSSTCLTMNES